MEAHRSHGNRIMHEAFLGQNNIKLTYPDHIKSAEILSKDDMHLYRHSTECPLAIQMFLDENPRYWRFVPMLNEEANQPVQNITVSTMDIRSADVREDKDIKLFIKNLPSPPPGYRFSMRQYHLQYAYFKSRRDADMPNCHLDLYNAKIIAVLPETGSTVLRQIVEALFITHAATKLNSSGHLVDKNSNNYDDGHTAAASTHHYHENIVWCQGLVCRPLPSFVTASTAMENTAPSK